MSSFFFCRCFLAELSQKFYLILFSLKIRYIGIGFWGHFWVFFWVSCICSFISDINLKKFPIIIISNIYSVSSSFLSFLVFLLHLYYIFCSCIIVHKFSLLFFSQSLLPCVLVLEISFAISSRSEIEGIKTFSFPSSLWWEYWEHPTTATFPHLPNVYSSHLRNYYSLRILIKILCNISVFHCKEIYIMHVVLIWGDINFHFSKILIILKSKAFF